MRKGENLGTHFAYRFDLNCGLFLSKHLMTRMCTINPQYIQNIKKVLTQSQERNKFVNKIPIDNCLYNYMSYPEPYIMGNVDKFSLLN